MDNSRMQTAGNERRKKTADRKLRGRLVGRTRQGYSWLQFLPLLRMPIYYLLISLIFPPRCCSCEVKEVQPGFCGERPGLGFSGLALFPLYGRCSPPQVGTTAKLQPLIRVYIFSLFLPLAPDFCPFVFSVKRLFSLI